MLRAVDRHAASHSPDTLLGSESQLPAILPMSTLEPRDLTRPLQAEQLKRPLPLLSQGAAGRGIAWVWPSPSLDSACGEANTGSPATVRFYPLGHVT